MTYIIVFTIVIFSVILILYSALKSTLEKNIDETLELQINIIKDSIETGLDASLRSYFKASAYNAYDLASGYQDRVLSEELTIDEAKELLWMNLREISIGESGYFSIINSKSIIEKHPVAEFIGTDVINHISASLIINHEENYFDYEWQNPNEATVKTKSMYSIYFEPWDIYILAIGYEEEFKDLVPIGDLEDNILATKFGETGYILVLDFEGNLLVHPNYKGVNMIDRDDSMGEITRKSIEEKNGKSNYMWKNPGETRYRKKVTVYSEIEHYDMIVAATAYESEFLEPLHKLLKILIAIFILAIAIVLALTIKVSDNITKPIVRIKELMDEAESGNLSVRSDVATYDEVGIIGLHFNRLLESLENEHSNLLEQLKANNAISDELRISLEDLKSTQKKLIEEERFSNMGRVVTRVSHHLNTPIGNAMMAVSFLEKSIQILSEKLYKASNEYDIEQNLTSIRKTIESLTKSLKSSSEIVASFNKLNVSLHLDEKREINLKEYFEGQFYNNWRLKLPKNIAMVIDCEELSYITIQSVLERVLNNLIENSLRHGFNENYDGLIKISISKVREKIEIIYMDNGVGISDERTEHIFEPFFSSSNKMNALSLGLNIIYNEVNVSLNGSIRYEKNDPTGVKFIIMI